MSFGEYTCPDCERVHVGDKVRRVNTREIVAVEKQTGPHTFLTTFEESGRPDPLMEGRLGTVTALVQPAGARTDMPNRVVVDWEEEPSRPLPLHWRSSAVRAVWVDLPRGVAGTKDLQRVS